MKVLVAYMSSTVNTKKVAEAIFGEIHDEKEIKRVEDIDSIGYYDISFLGFPVHGMGPDKKTINILEKLCINGRKVVLFITHASPQDAEELQETLGKFQQSACGGNVVDMFDCQGELAKPIKMIMSIMLNAKYRQWAKSDTSKGQPTEAQLQWARVFTRLVISKINEEPCVREKVPA